MAGLSAIIVVFGRKNPSTAFGNFSRPVFFNQLKHFREGGGTILISFKAINASGLSRYREQFTYQSSIKIKEEGLRQCK